MLGLCVFSAIASAQPSTTSISPTADELAASVQVFLDGVEALECDFQQDYWARVYERTTTARGHLRLQRPGRIRFDYTQPRQQVVVSDGATFTYYQSSDEGGQYYHSGADIVGEAFGFLIGTSPLADTFTSRRCTSASAPPDSACLELRPRQPDPRYSLIRLYVATTEHQRGQIVRVSIEDLDGNWNSFSFARVVLSQAFPPAVFTYAPPPGSHEITAPR